MSAETMLSPEILAKAVRSDNEYAWRVTDIPAVIECARKANLLNLGGQLQFLSPEGICECYWIEVDIGDAVPDRLFWDDRVEQSASITQKSFQKLAETKDFLAEGRNHFSLLARYESEGGSLSEIMCFVWYVEAKSG